MSNKIDGTNQGQPVSPRGVAGGKPVAGTTERSTPSKATPPATDSETVQLTSNAQMLERMSSMLETLEIQNQRLDSIMESIANGDYEIDAEKIATRLLMLERTLG